MKSKGIAAGLLAGMLWMTSAALAAENAAEIGVVPPSPIENKDGSKTWRLKTAAGELIVGRPENCDDGLCSQVAQIGAVTFEETEFVSPIRVIPSIKDPEYVALSVECGGSACSASVSLLDVSGKSALNVPHISIYTRGAKIVRGPENSIDVIGTAIGEETRFGDPVVARVRYIPRTRTVYRVRTDGGPDLIRLVGEHPEQMFQDSDLRPRLIELLGDKTRDVRHHFEVASGIQLTEGRYLLARGIQAHSGGSDEAQAIVDLVGPGIWITSVTDGKQFDVYQSQKLDDAATTVRRLMNEWLEQWGKKLK